MHTGNKIDGVVNYVLEGVRKRRLRVGDRLPPEGELCSLLGVSRTTVREAMKRLEAMNIIAVRRGDGTYIADPTQIPFTKPILFRMLLSDITWDEIFQYRETLEFSVLRCAILNATDKDIQKLRSCNDDLVHCYQLDSSDFKRFYAIDLRFHELLAQIANNRLLSDSYTTFFELTGALIQRNYEAGQGIEATLESHVAAIEALEKRDLFLAVHAAVITVGVLKKWSLEMNYDLFSVDRINL